MATINLFTHVPQIPCFVRPYPRGNLGSLMSRTGNDVISLFAWYLLSAIDRSAEHAHTFLWNMFLRLLASTEHATI
jgi:hypothetical protein